MEKTLGIIVEYNPFHNGHLYHLRESLKKSAASRCVAVMSGDFVQRGRPAMTDKWERVAMALSMGVNLVVEIPAVFAIQDAGNFARGGVQLLERSGVCDYLVFGSESNDIEGMKTVARVMVEHHEALAELETRYIKEGYSHPNARKFALKDFLDGGVEDYAFLASSNDILGLEYLKELFASRSSIEPMTIRRKGSDYSARLIEGSLSSATAIREAFYKGEIEAIRVNVPPLVFERLLSLYEKGRLPDLERFENAVIQKLRAVNRDHIRRFYGFTEGLDLRFSKSAMVSRTLDELLLKVKSKRFTYTRLQRLLLYFLFEIQRPAIKESERFGPQYLRVLGFDKKGRGILADMRERALLPIISTPSIADKAYRKFAKKLDYNLPPFFNRQIYRKHLEMDFRLSDYYTALEEGILPGNKMDIKRKPLIF